MFGLVAGFGLGQGALTMHAESVAVAASAEPDYVHRKFGEHGAKAESYVFAKGTRFGGFLRDPSLEQMQFQDIARQLVPDLAKQRYYPAHDGRNAELLIVVHWGITAVEEDPTNGALDFDKLQKDAIAYNASFAKASIADPGYMLSDLAVMGAKAPQAGSAPADNAQLLGYSSELQKEEYRSLGVANGMTDADRRLREDLTDERYFVVLMAYDLGSLREGKKGVKPRLLWSTHFSTRATGFSFATALPAMSRVAANFFGHQVDGLLLDAAKVPEGRVDVGQPRTIEPAKPN
jgi:hypothetical protein